MFNLLTDINVSYDFNVLDLVVTIVVSIVLIVLAIVLIYLVYDFHQDNKRLKK